ncbi:MAG TPA: AMP-binding protein, partial [Microbacterium sp.]|nr:AMP-binding protein [Microbacterium sp.]
MHNPGLGTWMRKRRQKSADKTALIYADGATMTYGQLADLTDRVSVLLSSRGVRKGDSVAY